MKDAPQTLVDDTDETSDSSAGSEKEEAPQTPTIKIRGINTLMMATKCKYYFQNPNKGGGETQEVKWDNIEHIYYITFSDAKGKYTKKFVIIKTLLLHYSKTALMD